MAITTKILNYNFSVNKNNFENASNEDKILLEKAQKIVEDENLGEGYLLVLQSFHTELKNNNHRYFLADHMNESIKTFYSPTPTPFIMFHKDETIPIGINIYAEYFHKPYVTPNGVASGYGKVVSFVRKDATVNGDEVIKLLKARQLLALSIGQKTDREDITCSICGESIYSCEHYPGEIVNGKECYMIYDNVRFVEISAVNTPADRYALINSVSAVDSDSEFIKTYDKFKKIDKDNNKNIYTIEESMSGITNIDLYDNINIDNKTKNNQIVRDNNMEQQLKDALSKLENAETKIENLQLAITEKDKAISTFITTLHSSTVATTEKDKMLSKIMESNDQLKEVITKIVDKLELVIKDSDKNVDEDEDNDESSKDSNKDSNKDSDKNKNKKTDNTDASHIDEDGNIIVDNDNKDENTNNSKNKKTSYLDLLKRLQ